MQTCVCLNWAARYNNKVVLIRPFNLLGSGMLSSTIGHLLWGKFSNCESGGSISLYYPEMIREFIDVDDAIAALWGILQNSLDSGIYNLCPGIPRTLREVTDGMLRACNATASVCGRTRHLKGRQAPIKRVVGNGARLEIACSWKAPPSLNELYRKLAIDR